MHRGFVLLLLSSVLFVQSRAQGRPGFEEVGDSGLSAPDHKLYQFFFMRQASLASRAAEKERQGKVGEHLRRLLATEAGLNSVEAAILDEVAQNALKKMKEIDQEAQRITQEAYATRQKYYPLPPPLPPELVLLQTQRNAVFDRARQKLRETLGDSSFERLEAYVRATVHVRGKSVSR